MKKVRLLLYGTVLLSLGLASCSKTADPVVIPVVKTDLTTAITAANTLIAASVEGTAAGMYPVGSKATYQAAIDAAQAVATNTTATQVQVTNSVTSLAAATTTFNALKIAEIDPTSLIAYWKFDEGSGTTVADATGNSRTGTLFVGSQYAGGGGLPTWSTDRKGIASKALHFSKGGHIEVASNAALNPTEMTIMLWAKLDSLNTTDCGAFGSRCVNGLYWDNYMISQNYWDGYKLQTQEAKKLFATVHAVPSIYDRDTDNSPATLKLKVWYQVAMTYKDGEMDLYVNGLLAKQWTNTPGLIKVIPNRNDFLIGQELPNALITVNPGYIINHFEGFMDEVRIYKKALSAVQVNGIYNQEKP